MPEQHTEAVSRIVEQFGADRARLMDIARAIHAELGYFSEETIGQIADALGAHRVEVRDAISFYAFFPREPKGRTTIRLCNSVVERMKGSDEIAKAFEEAVGAKFGETSADGSISLEYTPCIGMSDQAPAALVDGVVVTRLRKEDVPKIVAAIRDGKSGGKLHEGGNSRNEVEVESPSTRRRDLLVFRAGRGDSCRGEHDSRRRHQRDQQGACSRSRRRGLPPGYEVGFLSQGGRRSPLRGLQRRRGRTRHVQGSGDPDGVSRPRV